MKKLFLVALIFLLAACAPSRVKPTITTNSVSAFNGLYTKILSTKLNVPVPKPLSFKFSGEWNIKTDYFSLEKNLAFFTCEKDGQHIQLRGMNTIDLYRDPTFTIEKNVTEAAFVKYHLQYDHDLWKSKRETLVQSTSSAPIFNAEKSYGVIKTVNGEFQRCVLAAVVEDAFYMMTGDAIGSSDDICETLASIWNSRKPF